MCHIGELFCVKKKIIICAHESVRIIVYTRLKNKLSTSVAHRRKMDVCASTGQQTVYIWEGLNKS